MWQRIQTLYIGIETALITALFFGPKAVAATGEQISYISYIPYLILLIIITIFNVLALMAYKQRVFQMRTMAMAAIVTLALQIWLVVDYIALMGTTYVFRFTAIFPLVAVILDILAIRGIMSDIMVAESVNRLRSSRKHRK
ncbi:MAG: DUF4293 domain-containing protein [Bacteroidales bacterium]|nr:DUF4293 domain-containing protein [Bacteroidales bacterium]